MADLSVIPEIIEFEGLSPTGNGSRLFYLPTHRLLKHFEDTGNRSKFHESFLIPDICNQPAGIWKGLERVHQEEAFVYAGVPTGAFVQDHDLKIEMEIKVGQCFMVFVAPDFSITKWRWCDTSPEVYGFPIDYTDRFGEKLWPPA